MESDNDRTDKQLKVIIEMLSGTFDAVGALSQRFDLQEQKLISLDQRMQDGFAAVNARLYRIEHNQNDFDAIIARLQKRLAEIEKRVGIIPDETA